MASSNPARPPPGVRLCALADLADPGAKGFGFRDGSALFAGFVVRQGGRVMGYVDSCPHAGWPLASLDGRYLTRDGTHLICAGHGALFDLEGACLAGPCYRQNLEPWPVAVQGDAVVTA